MMSTPTTWYFLETMTAAQFRDKYGSAGTGKLLLFEKRVVKVGFVNPSSFFHPIAIGGYKNPNEFKLIHPAAVIDVMIPYETSFDLISLGVQLVWAKSVCGRP